MKKKIALILALVLLYALADGMIVTTEADEYTIVRQFGAVVRINDTPGASLKIPVIQTVTRLPKNELLYDMAASTVITSDKKTMVADSFVLWRISDPMKFVQTLSGSLSGAEGRIDAVVYNAMKTVISSISQEKVISGRDGELAASILRTMGSNLESYGIEVYAIETKRIDLPTENQNAVYNRMVSERDTIAASYQANGEAEAKQIRNDADKSVQITLSEANAQAEKLKAEGEAEYMRILAEAYDTPEEAEFYRFILALDMAKASLTSGEDTLVIGSDSPIARIFYP
ncbi:MAG: protease modulator HflC [Oscillospiraceae bacterium]|nr:protease modulator HflC [Oscillospiraceae bacterium]